MFLSVIGSLALGGVAVAAPETESTLANYIQTKMVLNKKFNIFVKSVMCINPCSLVLGDKLYGGMVVASADPKNPRILGTCSFSHPNRLKRNQSIDYGPTSSVKNIELPIAPNERIFHVFMVEHDKEDQAKVLKAYFDTWKNEYVGFMRIHDGNTGKVIRDIFWSTFRKLKGERRFKRNDEDLAGWAELGFGESSFMPADEDGYDNFINLFWIHTLGMNLARYRLNYRIEQAQ